MRTLILAILGLVLWSVPSRAQTYFVVPSIPYPTIAAALAAPPAPGDVILIVSDHMEGIVTVNQNVWIRSLAHVIIDEIDFTRGGKLTGVRVDTGLRATGLTDDFTVEDCHIRDGVTISTSNPVNIRLHNSLFTCCGDVAIDVLAGTGPLVSVTDCEFHDGGLRVNTGSFVDVIGNYFQDCGIELSGEIVRVLDNNTYAVNGVVGISVTADSQGAQILRNRIRDVSVGIRIESTSLARIVCAENDITNFETAVLALNSDGNEIRQNTICNGRDGIVVMGTGGGIVRNNSVADCWGDGLRWEDLVNGELVELNNIAMNGTGVRVTGNPASLTADCNNVWNQPNPDWVGMPAPGGTNISLDPLFCGLCGFDVESGSPCLPGSPDNPCGELIGAAGEGCTGDPVSVEYGTWGSIKARFR